MVEQNRQKWKQSKLRCRTSSMVSNCIPPNYTQQLFTVPCLEIECALGAGSKTVEGAYLFG